VADGGAGPTLTLVRQRGFNYRYQSENRSSPVLSKTKKVENSVATKFIFANFGEKIEIDHFFIYRVSFLVYRSVFD
jgi:hypothetical protein